MNNEKLFINNKKLISGYAGFHPEDIPALDIAISELIDAGVGKLKEVIVVDSDTYNWELILINNEDQAFYLELSEYGNLVELRKDGSDGEILRAFQCGVEEHNE